MKRIFGIDIKVMRKLKRPILLVTLIAFVVACQSTISRRLSSVHSTSFYIEEYRSKFPHTNIRVFNHGSLKDFSIDTPVFMTHFPILSDLALKVYQDTSRVRNVEDETTKVLYSIQQEKGHQGILIAGTDDDWVNRIIYYSYELKGKLIGSLTLYEIGGDGGYSTYSSGRFLNDSTYIRESINCGPVNDDLDNIKCDTATFKFLIHQNGRIDTLGR